MLKGIHPITTDVALKGLSEYWIELHYVLLETDDVAIQSEHVIDTAILKVLNVYVLVLRQLDEVANLVVFG